MKGRLIELYKATEELRKWQKKWKETKGIKEWVEKNRFEKYVDRLLLEINELENGKESNNKA